jgi:hypothetical protein
VSIKTKVRGTSNTFVGNTEIQHQGHRACLIDEVSTQLNVPTILTPASNNLLGVHFMGGVEQVSDLIKAGLDFGLGCLFN